MLADGGEDAGSDAAEGALRITTTELPAGRVGSVYDADLEAAGGTDPLVWELARGALPLGAILQKRGAIVAPAFEEDGVFGLVVRVTDAGGQAAERALVLVVDRDLAVTTTAMPRAYVGHRYNEQLGAAGGLPPYTFAIVGGTLPGGLHVADSGRVSGDPEGEGLFTATVQVTDARGNRAEGEVTMLLYGPVVALDRAVRDLEFCFARRMATLPVRESFEVDRVRVVVHLEAGEVGRMVLTLISPSGTEVYLTAGGIQGPSIDTVFGQDTETLEPLDAFAGERAGGTWILTLYDPRCPYPALLDEVAIVFDPRPGPDDSLVVEGWASSVESGRPSLRVAGGGLEQSAMDLTVERYAPGVNGVPEGGAGDDEPLGAAAAIWSTTIAADVATVGADGHVVAGEATGAGTITWEVDGRSGTLPLNVLPPDWVP